MTPKKFQGPKPKRQRSPSNFTVNFRAYADEICSREKAPHRWLSTKMGINRGAFSELYHGINRDPRLSTCLKISAALGLPLAALAAKSPEERKAYRDAVWKPVGPPIARIRAPVQTVRLKNHATLNQETDQ